MGIFFFFWNCNYLLINIKPRLSKTSCNTIIFTLLLYVRWTLILQAVQSIHGYNIKAIFLNPNITDSTLCFASCGCSWIVHFQCKYFQYYDKLLVSFCMLRRVHSQNVYLVCLAYCSLEHHWLWCCREWTGCAVPLGLFLSVLCNVIVSGYNLRQWTSSVKSTFAALGMLKERVAANNIQWIKRCKDWQWNFLSRDLSALEFIPLFVQCFLTLRTWWEVCLFILAFI